MDGLNILSIGSRAQTLFDDIHQLFKSSAEKYSCEVKELILKHIANASMLNRANVRVLMKQIRNSVANKDWGEAKYMFKSIFVRLVFENNLHLQIDMTSLLEHYPEYNDTDPAEKALLLQFRNYFCAACQIIDPHSNKVELISLVNRMCGAVYNSGGKVDALARRMLIYERETNISPDKSNRSDAGPLCAKPQVTLL